MKDNFSIVVTMLVFVVLIVIFPLYNYFERQDDMSYNLAMKSTTNFVDEVLESGYITQEMYSNYISELSNTGNIYDIELEAHKKILTSSDGNQTYDEQYKIDYNKDILADSQATDVMNTKVIKDNAYYLNEGDQFYVKMKNSNTTMAGAIFNTIVPTSSKDRIVVNYGGIVKRTSWAKVDALYKDLLSVNNNMPYIRCNQQTSWGYSNTDFLNGEKIYLSSGMASRFNGTLNFTATGPSNFVGNWHAELTHYVWKIDDGVWNKKDKNATFDVRDLSEGIHTIYVKALDEKNDLYSDEASLTIEVKKKVNTILAGVGWNTSRDMDLSFYFTKNGETSTQRIDYKTKIDRYGTITADDMTGSKDETSTFKSLVPSTVPYAANARINEYILLTENDNNFTNMMNDNIGRIDIFINCYTRPGASERVTFSEFLSSGKFVYSKLIIVYADNTFEEVEVNDFSRFSTNQTVRMATLKRSNNGDWILVSGDPVTKTLGDNSD